MGNRQLLLDAGNSRLKWVVLDDGKWCEPGSAAYSDLSALSRILEPELACHIASVAGERHERQIAELLQSCAISPVWLTSEARFGDVVNGYDNPRQLGVDRWMAAIAARRRKAATVLVVSVGTAMTVDAVSAEGLFLGGLIVPGPALMRQALSEGTARVAGMAGSWQAFPRATADAVESGIVAALCGAIQVQHAHLTGYSGETPACLLTGGGAGQLMPHLTLTVEHVPNLVLEGIARVAGEGGTA
jgi:type III pantothenate kinase